MRNQLDLGEKIYSSRFAVVNFPLDFNLHSQMSHISLIFLHAGMFPVLHFGSKKVFVLLVGSLKMDAPKEVQPTGEFTCQLCNLTAPYTYYGQKPPYTRFIV